MKFRSAEGTLGSPGIRRRLSISTRVRDEPRPRRSTVAVPVEAFEIIEPWPANTCGRELVMSSMRVTPWALMSALPTVVTGAMEVRFGDGIRVPVTTTSETSPAEASAAAAAAAAAWVADRPRKAAPQIIEEASRRSRVFWIFKVLILQRPAVTAGPLPYNCQARAKFGPGYAGVTFDCTWGSTQIAKCFMLHTPICRIMATKPHG